MIQGLTAEQAKKVDEMVTRYQSRIDNQIEIINRQKNMILEKDATIATLRRNQK